jgi:uncharacterized membrane protein
MSVSWGWLLLACAAAFAIKLAGYLVPARCLEGPRMARVAALVTVGLLAALVVVNSFAQGTGLVVDARAGALLAAVLALCCRIPFLGVVLVGALAAALLRLNGVA